MKLKKAIRNVINYGEPLTAATTGNKKWRRKVAKWRYSLKNAFKRLSPFNSARSYAAYSSSGGSVYGPTGSIVGRY